MSKRCLVLSTSHAACAALFVLVLALAQPSHAGFNLFNSREEQSKDLSAFPKWTKAIDRDKRSRLQGGKCSKPCPKQKWESLLSSLKSAGGRKNQLRQAHEILNKHPYIKDIVNWGVQDYWETPFQFLRVNGDCEDYAIAKYMALKSMGWDTDDMRIVVLQDNNLNLLHSVLAVRFDGNIYILDNQIDQLITHRTIVHYVPIYSINEHAWWRHAPK